jgi:hypothetical protein
MGRIALDEDTRAHLADWVEAGGVLVLAGAPERWPEALRARSATATGAFRVTARMLVARSAEGDEEGEKEPGAPVDSQWMVEGELSSGEGLSLAGATSRVAWFEDGTLYAAAVPLGRGYVVVIATAELLTNVALLRKGNARAMVTILSSSDRRSFLVAQRDDGVSPPSTPVAAVLRAGFGLGLAHALVASLVLFLAVGVRLARPKPARPPARRAFVEHVEAVGRLYARTGNAAHALAAYARFADERLRARMPHHATDLPNFLASRAHVPIERCRQLWSHVGAIRSGASGASRPIGDIALLEELSRVYSTAVAQDK